MRWRADIDTNSYQSFLIPISLMQGAGFTGAATGVNLARDIEQGWFDRLLVSPAPRPVLLAGLVISASLRSLIPAGVLALKFKSQSAAPLMQAGMFVLILTTTAYAPLALLSGWLHTVAKYNPATQIVEAARQGFIGGVTWGDTWPGLLALAGLLAVLTAFALRGMHRTAA